MTDVITLDEAKARTFLAQALRRWAGEYLVGSAREDGWLLEPGWDPHGDGIYADDTGDVENLVYYARHAGVITSPPDVDVDLMIDTGTDPMSDWMYQVRVSFHPGCKFALCSPYRHEYRKLGWHDDTAPKGKGAANARGVLLDVVNEANQIVAAFQTSAGTVPARPDLPSPV